jgi:very-short-patch-repair endonuclease
MDVVGTSIANQRARQFRKAMTKPERLLWWALLRNQTGYHFRRQHAAGPYVLDFYCDSARLCVEVDGESHDFRVGHDAARDMYLERWGILTLRIPAGEVLGNLQGVVDHIVETAKRRPLRRPLADTSPKGEERD